MRVSIQVRKNNLPEIAKRAAQIAADVIRETVADIEAEAKQRAPVDTGYLRDHIVGRVINQNAGEVVSEAPYSEFLEYGTRHAPAQSFMHPAADAARPRFEAAIAKALAGLG